jgi:RNA polymerase sigma-70 factor (ECF subfamily)
MVAINRSLNVNSDRQLKAKTDPVTDEQLFLEYRRTGDRELYAQLVYRYERELFKYLRRYLGNAELAEDVFQATFLAVHLKSQSFEEGRRFRPWLYKIATNKAIDAGRHVKRSRMISLDLPNERDHSEVGQLADMLESSEASPEDALTQAENARQVRAALEQLPESLSVVVHLVYYQGLKYREVAEALDLPVGTVKSRLHAAIARLTGVWQEANVSD